MPDRKNDNLSNDFNVAEQAAVLQKQREQAAKGLLDSARQKAEDQRQSELEKIQGDKERQDIRQELVERDKSIADNLDRLKEDQTTKLNAEINKEVNKQGNPALTMVGFGKSPQAIAQKVQADRLPAQEAEREAYVRGSFDVSNNSIDKKIQKTLEQEHAQELHRQQQIENRSPDQVFEASADPKTSKDAFTQAHDRKGGEKDWRQLRDERQQDDREL